MDTKTYLLKNVKQEEPIIEMTLKEVIEEVNRDRSEEWEDYNESDWQEGLEEFTEYTLIGIRSK